MPLGHSSLRSIPSRGAPTFTRPRLTRCRPSRKRRSRYVSSMKNQVSDSVAQSSRRYRLCLCSGWSRRLAANLHSKRGFASSRRGLKLLDESISALGWLRVHQMAPRQLQARSRESKHTRGHKATCELANFSLVSRARHLCVWPGRVWTWT